MIYCQKSKLIFPLKETILLRYFNSRLRDIKSTYNQIVALKSRSETILKNLEKENVLVDEMRLNILSAKTLEELEHLVSILCLRELHTKVFINSFSSMHHSNQPIKDHWQNAPRPWA